ncbi:hypothetical protein [Jeotgalibacillus salarius]|uniref:hypothetical protein n=1 Tax=Jeotgalibacillus salarius TaxID=546023 RepID=UPI00141BDF92|nr:hypothetical protein [Jeotgalibacillus salarius]
MDEQGVRLFLLISIVTILIVVSIFVRRKGKLFLLSIVIMIIVAYTYNELTLDQ